MDNNHSNTIKKIIPSKIEIGFQKFLYNHIGKLIPKSFTPNMVTLIGALGGLFSIISTILTYFSVYFFIGTVLGVLIHLVADDLDGYVARSRNMTSKAGAYFDLITDVFYSTFLLLVLGLTSYSNLEIVVFAIPIYAIVNVTAMNYIIYFNEFPFPRLGPIEAHLSYVVIAILSMIFKYKSFFTVFTLNIKIADIIIVLALIPMYYEMFRMAIGLFIRLKEKEKE